jgi:hypothetical protein
MIQDFQDHSAVPVDGESLSEAMHSRYESEAETERIFYSPLRFAPKKVFPAPFPRLVSVSGTNDQEIKIKSMFIFYLEELIFVILVELLIF